MENTQTWAILSPDSTDPDFYDVILVTTPIATALRTQLHQLLYDTLLKYNTGLIV